MWLGSLIEFLNNQQLKEKPTIQSVGFSLESLFCKYDELTIVRSSYMRSDVHIRASVADAKLRRL